MGVLREMNKLVVFRGVPTNLASSSHARERISEAYLVWRKNKSWVVCATSRPKK
ncbi:hypothetical protein Hdeb2414_s0004g00139041 [Helianthus debilis subsp. tardiflorus]